MSKFNLHDTSKDFRVWWSTGSKQRYFYVDNIEQAKLVYSTLSQREQDDDSVDYNAGGFEQYGPDGWEEWYNGYGEDLAEVMENE